LADEPENRRKLYLVVPAFILFCVDAGAAAHGLAHRSLTGLKRRRGLSVSIRCIVSLEDALENVAIGLEITGAPHADVLSHRPTSSSRR
jgi:hypothetical protein